MDECGTIAVWITGARYFSCWFSSYRLCSCVWPVLTTAAGSTILCALRFAVKYASEIYRYLLSLVQIHRSNIKRFLVLWAAAFKRRLYVRQMWWLWSTCTYSSVAWYVQGKGVGRPWPPWPENSFILTIEATKNRGWPPPWKLKNGWGALPWKNSCLRPWFRAIGTGGRGFETRPGPAVPQKLLLKWPISV